MKSRWIIVIAAVIGLGIGIAIGAGSAAGDGTEPVAEPEVITETVTETVEVEVGGECRDYADWILEQMDAKDAIVLAAFGEMADILDRDGFMVVDEYVTILERATAEMDALTLTMTAGGGFDCPRSS